MRPYSLWSYSASHMECFEEFRWKDSILLLRIVAFRGDLSIEFRIQQDISYIHLYLVQEVETKETRIEGITWIENKQNK